MELVDGQRVVRGTVKRAYPLQSLRQASSDGAAESANGELGTFGPGVGPCGRDASQLVAVVVENRSTFETCLVFFYDKWATKMQFLKRHFKLRISGRGLVALEWEAGAETEERVSCAVVAERDILKKTLERKPRLFTFPHSLSVEVAFEEPQRLPQSDQLKYLPSKTISTRDLHTAQPTRQTQIQVQPQPKKKPNYGKRTLGEAKLTSPMYRYSSLAELVDGYADIYGVVVNVTLPKKTSGRDFCMTVSVIDESCPTRAEAIQINIFYPMIAQMPKIKYVGDIIRFHKVKIQQYQDKIQGLCLPRGSRHLVVREQTDGKLEQLTCSDNWTFEASDEQRVRQLITWARNSLAEDATLPQGCALAPKLLAELRFAENFIDLVEVQRNQTRLSVRSIWPADVEKICKLKPGSHSEYIYSFALTVEDGSDSLNIIVYGKDAEHFLHGIPPCDLTRSTSSKTLLEKRFAALSRSPEAFHWCIKSYLVSLPPSRDGAGEPATAVRYRLFDTRLQIS
ncbi:putative telomere binding protein [Phytophthora cinnamomi]|uniref:putative telomere binding protein n=1 Tax=Phytophthora cinnamomi TaxID=4785 RepID=UPI00355ABAA6|nr:putative telomere binding protein [Phytophthora cinnamomi]